MIGSQVTGRIHGVTISAVAHEKLSVEVDGQHASLAVVTDDGHVVVVGDDVAREARAVSVNCYRQFLQGTGRLRVYSKPIGDAPAEVDMEAALQSAVRVIDESLSFLAHQDNKAVAAAVGNMNAALAVLRQQLGDSA